jgi:hypothetical protein
MDAFETDLRSFEVALATDIRADVAMLSNESEDFYAYAIVAPDDPGNLYIVSQIAKGDGFSSELSSMPDAEWWEKILCAFSDRYTDPQWESKCGNRFDDSNAILESIQKRWSNITESSDRRRLLERLYESILRQLHQVRRDSLVPDKCLMLIEFRDNEHSITRTSYNRLNPFLRFARLWPLYNIHPFAYVPFAFASNMLGKLIGERRHGG